jgi:predicted ATP-grasp superfamily ATP-dependent carboligase
MRKYPRDESATVLVTGAEEHQGLAVIRALGQRGIRVIACGSKPHSMGFVSRYCAAHYQYASPLTDPDAFMMDIRSALRKSKPALLIPAVESSLVALDANRSEIEQNCRLAAPPSHVLRLAFDKFETIRLAGEVGVPAPVTIHAASRPELLRQAGMLTFPVAVKPRGPRRYAPTAHRLPYKSVYAHTPAELQKILETSEPSAGVPLVQELAKGIGLCVTALCDGGEPVALFSYVRLREVPASGGVSVVRRSIETPPVAAEFVRRLMRRMEWQGIAMIEFKYDAATDSYKLMEVNGRVQASIALAVDAGVDFPYLMSRLYSNRPLPPFSGYRIGVTERWLRGDLIRLLQELSNGHTANGVSRAAALWQFIAGFAPRTKYDEFRLADPRPGLVEAGQLTGILASFAASGLRSAARAVRRKALHAAAIHGSSALGP